VLKNFGLEFSYVDTTDAANVENALRENTQLIFVETPTNPILAVADLEGIGKLARSRGVRLAVDNTFMSPYFLRPIELGASIVIHSTTKYLNGHSDSVGGVAVSARPEDAERIGFLQNTVGAIISPFDSFLILRGIKTLAVRMKQHDENGRRVAAFLAEHPRVKKVYYPGLPNHPQYERAKRQMSGFGGMIAFETGSLAAARTVLDNVRLCALAESLGGVETLISHPATMTHASVPADQRARLGITDGLVRISVGIEDVDDIIADLDSALQKA
jgi:cystathionine beta-lyase/cystathionine gamma-synthase